MTRKPGIVIVGGGAIGSAVACFLAAEPGFGGTITVIERDPVYRQASSALSASSIRQQFSTPLNIAMSRFGFEFLRAAGDRLMINGEAPAVGLVESAYLFLASEAGLGILAENHRVQKEVGVEVALLDPPALAARFPWLSVEGVAGASLGLGSEGWFDGYALLQALRRRARALGVCYEAAEAVSLEVRGGRVRAVGLNDGRRLPCDTLVNAAGPWAARLAAMAGIELPVRARRRSVFVFDCRAALPGCPLVIDYSGVWFRPEGGRFICGFAPDPSEDPDDAPLELEHAAFEAAVWPILAQRVPAFEAIKPAGGWAGYYEYNTVDRNGIVGPHPEIANLLFANGFSGHGLQHAPAVGRGLAELIVHGGYRSLDLSPLGFERLAAGRPLIERNVI